MTKTAFFLSGRLQTALEAMTAVLPMLGCQYNLQFCFLPAVQGNTIGRIKTSLWFSLVPRISH